VTAIRRGVIAGAAVYIGGAALNYLIDGRISLSVAVPPAIIVIWLVVRHERSIDSRETVNGSK
jgi:hypothetical protein